MENAGPSSSSLRIALVCPYSLSRPGGVQGQVIGLARALEADGHHATVFAPLDDAKDAPTGVDLVATGRSVSLPANGSVAPVSLSVRSAARALHALTSMSFDVVHVHEPFTPGLPYGLLVGRGVPPLVATFHRNGDSALYTLLGPVVRRLARRLAVRTAVSEAARATAWHALGGTYEVGFNGIEMDRYRDAVPWPTDRPTILFLGRHEERKGLRVLLEAFDRLAAGPGAEPYGADHGRPLLWIAGDGPHSESLRREHPGSSDVVWLGVLPEDEKVRRLAAADVLCAPSLGGESFGMVLLEAMAARTPVVASDIDGYRSAADGCAVLVPPGDRPLLADALAGVLAGELAVSGCVTGGDREAPRRCWLSAAARRAERWSMPRLAGWYEGWYRSAMVGPRP
ncbi:MAG: glycosyltransferase family 4 protein [Acidimicrobiales bacterium]